jgi:alpha-D-ribose 1-methylphosphonate 5-triphosphate diphosphatase PhnM
MSAKEYGKREEMEKEIKRYLDIQAERFTHDLGFVIDEVKAVEERLNRKIESEIGGLRKELKQEIREVRQELISHRDNTEMHVQKAKTRKRA